MGVLGKVGAKRWYSVSHKACSPLDISYVEPSARAGKYNANRRRRDHKSDKQALLLMVDESHAKQIKERWSENRWRCLLMVRIRLCKYAAYARRLEDVRAQSLPELTAR